MEQTKTWTRETVQDLLMTNDRAVERALLVLLDRQTFDEQTSKDTKHQNGRGFTQADARIMTEFAVQVKRGRSLTPSQLRFLRNRKSAHFHSRIGKYAKQLLDQIQKNEAAAAAAKQPELAI